MKVPAPDSPACWGVISCFTAPVTNLILLMTESLVTQVEVEERSPNLYTRTLVQSGHRGSYEGQLVPASYFQHLTLGSRSSLEAHCLKLPACRLLLAIDVSLAGLGWSHPELSSQFMVIIQWSNSFWI